MDEVPFINFLLLQALFKNEKLVLICKDNSNEELMFTLYYKHEDDDSFQEVNSKNKQVDDKGDEYRVEYIIPDVKTGEYTCKIQSKCDFGRSEMSNEISVLKENQVNNVNVFLL